MKPSIYIGLGGTGIMAVSHVKKMYEDSFGVGNIPPHIAFLVLDYDYSEYTSPHLATSIEDDAVPLNYNGDPRDYYRAHVENGAFNWMFEKNPHFLMHPTPYRTTGRFYTELLRATIEQALQARWQQVTNFIHGVANVDIHIVTSLCGGTGAGSFINVAEMIQRNLGNHANIIGYGVLHGIFREMNPCPTSRPFQHLNAYSAILDLDYLMSASMDNPITFEINGAERTLTRPIFDEFFAIDNITPNGFIANEIDTLCKNIAVYLFADNLNTQNTGLGAEWFDGRYNILNKKGWVQSFGACQIVYKGEELSEIYANRYAAKLIEKMLQQSDNVQEAMMKWIANVDLEKDMLISRISDISRIDRLREPNTNIQDTIDVTKAIINSYLNNIHEIATEKTNLLKEEYTDRLEYRIEELLRKGNVAVALQFLDHLRLTLGDFLYEMRKEVDGLKNNELARISRILYGLMDEYETSRRGFFGIVLHRPALLGLLGEINDLAKRKLKITYEIKRREIAVEIYNSLIELVYSKLKEIDRFINTLHSLHDEYDMEASKCMHTTYNKFECDLSRNERVGMHVDDSDIALLEFSNKFYKPLLKMDIEHELKPAIYDFAKSRPQAMDYRQRCISDIIDSLNDDNYERLKNEIYRKSDTLLRINNRGQRNNYGVPSELMVRECIFLCDNRNMPCRLQFDNSLSCIVRGADCTFVTNGQFDNSHQKMFILRKDYAVIPYCIDSLNEIVQDAYEKEVRNSSSGQTFNPHFDKTLFEEMRKQNFRLEPRNPDSPEETPNT